MKTTEQLLAATKDIWAQYDVHPFVQGIADGTLDVEKFRYYLKQDYLYLEEYTKLFGIGMAKAKSPETAEIFVRYIRLLTETELDIHRGYFGRLQLCRAELEETERALDNLSYTSYMLRVAYEEGEAEILTATLSCALSYEKIARNMVRNHPDAVQHPFYGEWVRGYLSATYSRGNVLLLDTIDRLTEHYTVEQKRHLQDIFVACSRYELAFWDLAWEMRR